MHLDQYKADILMRCTSVELSVKIMTIDDKKCLISFSIEILSLVYSVSYFYLFLFVSLTLRS